MKKLKRSRKSEKQIRLKKLKVIYLSIALFMIFLIGLYVLVENLNGKFVRDSIASKNADIAKLQEVLKGKSYEEALIYLEEIYGAENVHSLAPPTDDADTVVQDPLNDLLRRLGYDNLSPLGKQDIDRDLERIKGNKKEGCIALQKLWEVARRWADGSRTSAGRPPMTYKSGGGNAVVTISDAEIMRDIAKSLMNFFDCKNPPGRKPDVPPVMVPMTKEVKKFLDHLKDKYGRDYNPFSLEPRPVPVPAYNSIPALEPASTGSLIPTIVITGIVVAIVLIVLFVPGCGALILSVLSTAASYILGLFTAQNVATAGGAAALFAMLATFGGAQSDPLTTNDALNVQHLINQNTNNPTYFEQYKPKDCGSLDLGVGTQLGIGNLDYIPYSLDPILPPITPSRDNCNSDPNQLANLAHALFIPSQSHYVMNIVVMLPGISSVLSDLQVVAVSSGIDSLDYFTSGGVLNELDFANFCYGKSGPQSFEITLRYNDRFGSAFANCNSFTFSGVVDCTGSDEFDEFSYITPTTNSNPITGNPAHPPLGGPPIPKTPVLCTSGKNYDPGTEMCQSDCPGDQICKTELNKCVCVAKEKLCSNPAVLQTGQQCKNDCGANAVCSNGCTACVPKTSGDPTGSSSGAGGP